MKKFTKVMLIIVAVMLGIGIVFCGISSVMGAGMGTIRQMAKSGELDYGFLNFTGIGHWDDWYDDWDDRHDAYHDLDDLDDLDELDDLDDLDDDRIAGNVSDSSQDAANGNTADPGGSQSSGNAGGSTAGQSSVIYGREEIDSSTVVYRYDPTAVTKLDIDIDMANVIVTEGEAADQIAVELYRCKEQYYGGTMDGSALELEYDTENHVHTNNQARITITLPKEMYLEKLDLDAGATEVRIDHTSLVCSNVDIEVGAGNVTVEGFTSTGKFTVEAGAGNVEIRGGNYRDVKLDCGVGNFEMEGRINGSLEAECSMGNMDLQLTGKETEYNYDLSCSMGDMNVNGHSHSVFSGSHHENNPNAIGTIRLDCSMGNIDLWIEE